LHPAEELSRFAETVVLTTEADNRLFHWEIVMRVHGLQWGFHKTLNRASVLWYSTV
jgi:hypothetical protein